MGSHTPSSKETIFIQEIRDRLEGQKYLGYHDADLLIRCVHKLLSDVHWLKGEAQSEVERIRKSLIQGGHNE